MNERLQIAATILTGMLAYRSLNQSERDMAVEESLRLADALIKAEKTNPTKAW